jgi:hypothetical protein
MQPDPGLVKFEEWGLVYPINRAVLHPVGLEMFVEEGVLGIRDATDEPYLTYQGRRWKDERKKFLRFMREAGRALMARRQTKLGFVVQPEPDDMAPSSAAAR